MHPAATSRLLIAAAALAAGCKDGVGPDGRVASVLVSPKSAKIYSLAEQVQFSAQVTTEAGTVASTIGVNWKPRDPTLITVSSAGVVTALKRGGTTWLVAEAGAKVDSAEVDVPADLCTGVAISTLAQEQVVTDLANSSICTAGVAANFTLIIHNNSLSSSGLSALEVTATGVDEAPRASIRPTTIGQLEFTGEGFAARRSYAADRLARQQEKSFAPTALAAARSAYRNRATRDVAPPAVGSTLRVNANTATPCDTTFTAGSFVGQSAWIDARVAAVSSKAIILDDPRNPSGGFSDGDYAALAARFDAVLHPLNTEYFGDPTDIDGNGRTILFFTRAINERTPNGASFFIGGLTHSRDFLQRTSCPGSNVGEIFYLLVPDPEAAVNGNPLFRKSFVEQVTEATIVHEYQHMISGGRRTFQLSAPTETIWLNEGLSHMAEELLYYRVTGRSPRGNLGAGAVVEPGDTRTAWFNYLSGNFLLYDAMAGLTRSASPFRTNDELETRGATWSFLRFAADQRPDGDGSLWRDLVNSPLTGIENLQSRLGVSEAGLRGLLRDYTISVYADDHVAGLPAKYQQLSWNMRDMYDGVNSLPLEEPFHAFPLRLTGLNDGETIPVIMQPGGFAVLRFRGLAGANSLIRVTGASSGPLPANTVMTLIRTR